MTDRPTDSRWAGGDVLAGLGWLVFAWLVVALPFGTGPVRAVVVAPLLFVLPGYALQAALFTGGSDLTVLERVVVSIALSVTGAIAVGLALGVTFGVTAVGSLLGLSALTVGGFAVAVVRDPTRELALGVRREVWNPVQAASGLIPATGDVSAAGSSTEKSSAAGSSAVGRTIGALVVLVGVGGLLATAFLFGVHQPPGGATLELGPAGGSWNGSTTDVGTGDSIRLSLTHSYPDRRSFVVVAVLQETGGDGLDDVRELDRFLVELEPGKRWSRVHDPSIDGDRRLRLTYRLYSGSETTGNPRTNAHLWFGPGNTSTATANPTPRRVEQSTHSPRLADRPDATIGGRL